MNLRYFQWTRAAPLDCRVQAHAGRRSASANSAGFTAIGAAARLGVAESTSKEGKYQVV